MSPEGGPRHASPEPAEPAAEYEAPPPWPGPAATEPAQPRPSSTGPVRATASVPMPTSVPPAPAQPPYPQYDQPAGSVAEQAREAGVGYPAEPPRVPNQPGPHGQAYPAGEHTTTAGPPQPAPMPAAAPPQAPAQPAPPVAGMPDPSPAVPSGPVPPGPSGPILAAAEPRRATGTAHVPEVALLPAHQLPALPKPVPRVYGNPALHAPNPAGQAMRPSTASAAPAGVAAARVAPPPPQPGYPPPQPGYPPPQPGYPPPQPGYPPPQTPYQPAPAESGPPPVPQWARPVGDPANPPGTAARPSAPEWRGAGEPDERPVEAAGSHIGLLIAVGAVVLLAVVGLTAWMWPRTNNTPAFAVNSCVKQVDNVAVAADCTAAGAFTILSRVDNKDLCPDARQPYVELSEGENPILCLAPANAPQSSPGTT